MKQLDRIKRMQTYYKFYTKLPVQSNTIYYHAYRTKIMSGNPYAIFLELLSRPEYSDFKHVWVYGSDDSLQNDTFKRFANHKNVSYVLTDSTEHMEALATCQYLITNAALPDYFQKREGQVVINTWHGTPLKTLGKHAKDFSSSAIANAQRNFLISDYLVMPNKYTSERLLDSYAVQGVTQARVLDFGYPRCDLVLNTDRNQVLSLLENTCGHSLEGKRIVLYAPTFRSEQGRSQDSSIEMSEYMRELEAGLPNDYEIFFKVHNTLGSFFKHNSRIRKHLIFDEIETNELLAATDILITDYSSIFFDYICTNRPIILFAYDKDTYVSEHGTYLDMESLPGTLCSSVSEVLETLDTIESGQYSNPNVEEAYRLFAYNDDGHASQRVVDVIFNDRALHATPEEKTGTVDTRIRVLISMEDNTRISASMNLFSLLRQLDSIKYQITICAHRVDIIWHECMKINPEITILFSKVYFDDRIHVSHDDDFYRNQYMKYFPGMEFDCYYNLKKYENLLDEMLLRLYPNIERHWILNWSSWVTPKRILEKTAQYKDVELTCYTAESIQSELVNSDIKIVDRKAIIASPTHKMTVLFLATFDSMNYPLAALAKELSTRGHHVIVISQRPNDVVNNAMFAEAAINVLPVNSLDDGAFDYIDLVVTTPLKPKAYYRIFESIRMRNTLTFAFSSLFSSVAMRPYPDFVLTLGESKHDEFEENHLQYSCIATGNPQYDVLLPLRRTSDHPIRRVLVAEQGGYPYGEKGKQQLADTLVRLAKSNPEIEITVKPRYIPNTTGRTTHNVSEHVYDFLHEVPENLILLNYPTILEDILPSFDALITLWSTAYLDALMLDIPLLLLRGFDSHDVFDVRAKRVERAYNHLEGTGCLYHYNEVEDLTEVLSLIDQDYADYEVYRRSTPCATRIAALLEICYRRLVIPNMRPNQTIRCNADSFENTIDKLQLIDADSDDFKIRIQYLECVNTELQEYVYLNRCMGEVLNLSPLATYYSRDLTTISIEELDTYLENIRLDMRVDFYAIETEFFTSGDGKKAIQSDRILQSFYYRLLYELNALDVLKDPPCKNLAPESQSYYIARSYLDSHRYESAYKHLFDFIEAGSNQNVIDLLEYRRFNESISPFKDSLPHKLLYFRCISKLENAEVIDYIYQDSPENSLYAANCKLRILIDEGKYEDALRFANVALQQFQRRKNKGSNVIRRLGNEFIKQLIFLKRQGVTRSLEEHDTL